MSEPLPECKYDPINETLVQRFTMIFLRHYLAVFGVTLLSVWGIAFTLLHMAFDVFTSAVWAIVAVFVAIIILLVLVVTQGLDAFTKSMDTESDGIPVNVEKE